MVKSCGLVHELHHLIFCCSPFLLEPTDPLFRRVGNMFVSEVSTNLMLYSFPEMPLFGTGHTLNAGTPNKLIQVVALQCCV